MTATTTIDHLAIVGATGAVGQEVIAVLKERKLAVDRLLLLASAGSVGLEVAGPEGKCVVAEATPEALSGVEFAIFSAGSNLSKTLGRQAALAGTVVIDNSSAFRMDPDVPLVIPEVNAQDLCNHRGIIANPNCSTIIMNLVVWPLHKLNRVRRIVVSTYQAASGAGASAMEELRQQTADVLAGDKPEPRVFPVPCAFNLFSHNTPIGEDGYNTEERKMIDETRKIFHDDSLAITATCIRVPVLRAHSESINLTFEGPITATEVRDILRSAPGIRLVDERESGQFPTPLEASGIDDCLVGRVREDKSQPDGRGIELFVCGDQLRKGAALNAVQILEHMAQARG